MRLSRRGERERVLVRLPSVTAVAGSTVWAPELEALYRARYDRMVRVAYLVCGDRAAAEETPLVLVVRVDDDRWFLTRIG
jgi:hypothetical protein